MMRQGMEISIEAEALAFCQELVRCPSLSGQERGVADLVERQMAMLGYDRIERDELGSLVGVIQGARPGARVLFDAHMDVVPITSPGAWRYDALSAARVEGRIWGRGATDVKGSLAAVVVALGALRRESLCGTLIVSASVGEEMVEGLALARVLRRFGADRVVICEPTGLRVGIGHKGRAGLVLTAEGVAAHSSRPELGVNAVYRMMEAVGRVRAMAPHRDELLGAGVSELVEIVSSPFPGTSMLPESCTARFDRRLVRGETAQSVLDELHQALDGLRGLTIAYHQATLACYTGQTWTVDDFHPAWCMASNSEIVARAQQSLAEAGQETELCLLPYCSNGVASAGEMNLPTLVYGAGEIEDAHAVNESLRIDQLAQAVCGYQALARGLSLP